MKINLTLNSAGAQSAQAAHKVIQTRSHVAKSATHRYERRKVREFLRHADATVDEQVEFAGR